MMRSPAPPPVQGLKTVVSCILSSFTVEFGGELVLHQLLHHGQKCEVSTFLPKTKVCEAGFPDPLASRLPLISTSL